MADKCGVMNSALARAATGASRFLEATAMRQLWEVVAEARIAAARKEDEEWLAHQRREVQRAAEEEARRAHARRLEEDRRTQLLDVLRQRCQRLSAIPDVAPEGQYWKAGEGVREAAAVHFRRSLSSAEKAALANIRGALRQTFEKQLEEFWSRSAAESQLRAETDSAAAFAHLGHQECHRALERSWRQARNADVLLAVRLGDTLDVWDPFDDLQCPCDPGLLRPGPRPCTSCLPAVEDAGEGRWSWLLARFGWARRTLRA